MNFGLWIFSGATVISLGYYLWLCGSGRIRPQMNDAFGLMASSLTLAGASKVFAFAVSVPPGKTQVLIAEDLTLGAALVMSSLCLFWRGLDSIVTAMIDTSKKCSAARPAQDPRIETET